MNETTRWEPVARASAHLSLHQAAITQGFDGLVLRELMRVINAHPSLVAHARVLENLASLLADIRTGAVGRLGGWQIHLDEWIRFCEWAASSRGALSRLSGLHQFDEQPKHAKDHPHIGEGVDRHSVVAAMWNRHESVWIYPAPADNVAAQRYYKLQAHLLHTYIDARWTWVKLDAYETHVGAKEWPVAPAPTAAAARAIREFSHAAYDRFLSELDTDCQDTDFYLRMQNFEGQDDQLPKDKWIRAEAYLIHLKRYFKAAGRVQSGKRPRKRHHAGGGGGTGSKVRIPGFVSVPKTGLVIGLPHANDVDCDGDDAWPTGGNVYWGMPVEEGGSDLLSQETSGWCPSEDLEPVLELVDADEYAKAMHRIQYGQLAREMAAQAYAWDWNQITSGELQWLWTHLEHLIGAADKNPLNKSVARYNRISALLVKLMLMFGQTFERAHALRVRWVSPDEEFTPTDTGEEIESFVLFIQGNPHTASPGDNVLGFGLPALSPIYKTELSQGLGTLSRESADGLVLPDLSNLGRQLLAFHRSESVQDDKIFHIVHPTALHKVKTLLSSADKRVSLARITRALPSMLIQQTGDASLAWMACADTARQTEPRLFYTMHSTARIRMVYAQAARAMLRSVGHSPSSFAPDPVSKDPPHIGCRFVLSLPVLRDLIASLKARLVSRYAINNKSIDKSSEHEGDDQAGVSSFSDRYKDMSSLSTVMQYDRDHLFYTFLILTISTGTRAVNRPAGLYLQWLDANEPKNGLATGLWDKESMFFDKSRLVGVLPILAQQFKHYREHIACLMGQLNQAQKWKSTATVDQLLITFDKKFRPQPLSPAWITQQFEMHLGAPVPSNFSRAFLRTELLARGVQAELIDAFLGHANAGESPFAKLSTFDYSRFSAALQEAVTQLLTDLGLSPIESRLVPYPTRRAAL